ncbi:MAG: divergent polysaccharide deacetylase family protein [Pasteurella sp.]|nr:divergent polysaccharide deacetylase family protein [Pasteurella sp.]
MIKNRVRYKRLNLKKFLQILLLITPLANASKLAIVIDDIGYRNEDNAIYKMPLEVSVSIIPVSPYATERAEKAFAQQRDILIHQPMQPLSNIRIEDKALKLGMDKIQIQEIIEYARKRVPYAIGLNNHMGSAATANQQLMNYLMEILANEQLFFLDSKTNGRSVAEQTAKSFYIPALSRNIFLDDSNELNDVQRQFNSAVRYAQKNGLAILIGHPRKNSIKVLKQGIKNLPDDVELVKISSLWRNEKVKTPKPLIMFFEMKPAQTSTSNLNNVPLLRGVPKE